MRSELLKMVFFFGPKNCIARSSLRTHELRLSEDAGIRAVMFLPKPPRRDYTPAREAVFRWVT